MARNYLRWLLLFGIILSVTACHQTSKTTLFKALTPDQTGIHFNNRISEKDSVINEYLYMGGGVGIGDFNKDGLKDIYFTGNQVSSKLYINKGNNRFKDITQKAKVATNEWATGVSIVDINNDGYDDIYVCVYGGKNLLFINQHNLTFKEEASDYGLDVRSYSTQAAFLDYDKDGKTDVFLINYLLNGPNPNVLHPKDTSGDSPANDKLYHNIGDPKNTGHPHFVDVSKNAGIREDGYGLGVSISDFNDDSWPDLYVTNDFLSNDELWLNNKDGTFTNITDAALKHQSYSSMGVDAADVNNDRLSDIISLDMLPKTNSRKKLQYTFMDYNRYQRERSRSYEPEFSRNMLQLNNGTRKYQDKNIPFFSEIGQYAGISATNWSWSVLAADFNNDQWKDLYITNGSGRDFLNADFINYSISHKLGMRGNPKKSKKLSQKLRELGYIKSSNFLYLNNHDYTFVNAQDTSGASKPSISNGAAYVDLDNDGDWDLVVSNINQPASVFINTTIQSNKNGSQKSHSSSTSSNHYLQVTLKGNKTNKDALGTKVYVYTEGISQMQEEYPVRGYASSVDKKLLFGLGPAKRVDSLITVWPDGKRQIIQDISADTLLHLQYEKADPTANRGRKKRNTLFKEVTGKTNVHYKHLDVSYNDFRSQPLLPQKYSQLGPFITKGDVDNDGLTDFFIGGGFNSSGALFKQQKNDHFNYIKFDTTKKYQEDMKCTFFDMENDGDQDLLITYGDTRYHKGSIYYKPRLYINDGNGHFQLYGNAIPDHVRTIAGAVAIADYDGDGYKDIFIGGRVSNMYPKKPKSYLLRNNQDGTFKDVTQQVSPALQKPGMITSAVWTDINKNNLPDLAITGEWMPLRIFENNGSQLHEITDKTGIQHIKGMWKSLVACDIDKDGDTDFIAGNLGANNKYHVTRQKPLKLFASDIDKNGLIDPVMFYYIKDQSGNRNLYPAYRRDKLLRQVQSLHKVFPTNKAYSTATFDDIFGTVDQDNILEYTVNETKSSIFENTGGGQFVEHQLPAEVQFSPVDAIICNDFNHDGKMDLLLAGNEYQTEVRTGRYDASYGSFLQGDGNLNFKVIPPTKSGFLVDGDVKDMSLIKDAQNKTFILVAINNDSMEVFGVNSTKN